MDMIERQHLHLDQLRQSDAQQRIVDTQEAQTAQRLRRAQDLKWYILIAWLTITLSGLILFVSTR